MKVKELIKELGEVDPDLEVIIAKDPEGNGYSPLAGYDDEGRYYLDWEAYQPQEVTQEIKKSGVKCIVLFGTR